MTKILDRIDQWGDLILPHLARLVFAGVLLGYFWSSALTKFEGPFTPSAGAFAQIFPRSFEALNYDVQALSLYQKLIALAGSWAELVLPTLIVIGLATRLAALGMAGFILVQSLTDIIGHGADAETVGRWFDRASDALILDQRALWLLLLAILVAKGGGMLSLDRVFLKRV